MGSTGSLKISHLPVYLSINILCLLVLTVQGNNTIIRSTNLTSNRQIPYCYVDLFFPDACKDPENPHSDRFSKHFYALNIDFKTKKGNEARGGISQEFQKQLSWNVSENTFCSFKEIPKFPLDCISNNESIAFRDHVNCTNYDVFEMDRNYNYTTGLRITCMAPYALELKYEKPIIPYEGVKVAFAKVAVVNISQPYFQIQLQIPGEFKPGNLYEFSGNYTIFSTENPFLKRQLKIKVLRRNYGFNSTEMLYGDTPELLASDGRIKCCSKNRIAPVSLVVVQASNPMEEKLLRSCLDTDKTCSRRIVGKNCSVNRQECQELFPVQQHGIIRCSCGLGGENVIERGFFMGLNLLYYQNYSQLKNLPNALINLHYKDGRDYTEHVDDPQDALELYDRGNFTFLCYFLDYFLVPPVAWTITFKNGSETDLARVQHSLVFAGFHVEKTPLPRKSFFTARAVKAELSASLNMTSIRCRATLWNSSDHVESSLKLIVMPSEKPAPITGVTKTYREIQSPTFELACYWKKVSPEAKYEWLLQGRSKNKLLTQNDSCVRQWSNETTGSSHLYICNTNQDWNGTYTCLASNFLGNASQMIKVQITNMKGQNTEFGGWTYLGIASACTLIVLLTAVIIGVCRLYRSQRARLTELEIRAFEKGDEKALNENKMTHEIAQYLPYNRDFEIPWKNFETDYEELGHGAYGIVYKGKIANRIVAAKTVHEDVDKCAVLALLSELKIMIYLGKHENLVELVGACTEFLREGRPYLFVEFCSKGSLDSVLKKGRKRFLNEIPKEQRSNSIPSPTEYVNLGEFSADENEIEFSAESMYENVTTVTTTDLIRWSCQIANAMEYLESKKVIHGDLATRNVLLTSTMDVKVTDFGLARQLNNYSMYVKTNETPLPWRWLALESLRDMVFTSKSDVWAYGITLWEIFTLAEIPYPGANYCDQVLEDLEIGYRMRRPKYSTVSIYDQIMACWNALPEERPSFTELKEFFSNAKPFDYMIPNSQRLSDEGIVMSDSDNSPLL